MLLISEFYETAYRPARHPGDEHRATVSEFRTQINNLNRLIQFPLWCEVYDNPARGLPLEAVYQQFQWWLRRCDQPTAWLSVEDYSDRLIVDAMHFLVEVGRERITANKVRLQNNAIWRFAKSRGLIATEPQNENYRINLDQPLALLPDELDRVLIAAAARPGMVGEIPAGIWWPRALWFVFSSGVRITAAFGIPSKNLDLVRGEVLVPAWAQKNRREQRLDLFPNVVEMLRDLRLVERRISTVLGDWSLTINQMRRHYKEILVAADIGYGRVEDVPSSLLFHCLRKTLASMLCEKAGLHVACDRLGHSSVSVTRRYWDPRYGAAPSIAEILPNPLGSPPASPTLKVWRPEAG
jgi:integrase